MARSWRRIAVGTSLGLVLLSGCDAFKAHTDVVARAGGHELTVDRLLRVEEVAVVLGVSTATVRRWCSTGLLEGISLPGLGLRVRAASVAAISGSRS